MTWTAESFLERALNPRKKPPWWVERWDERSLENALTMELASDIQDFRSSPRKLFFFSTSGMSSIDGRAGPVGVELKYTNLSFEAVLDGAIHRGVVWVMGNPHQIDAPEAVALHVIKPGSSPMPWDIGHSLVPVLNSLAILNIHVAFVHAGTGDSWWVRQGANQVALPSWLATQPGTVEPLTVNQKAVDQLDHADFRNGLTLPLFGRRRTYQMTEGPGGIKLARVEWPNEWQLVEISLLLRGEGSDAVKGVYCGTRPLTTGGRGVERRIQKFLREHFGVVLDWGVPI
jgi:hypothetical protein